MRDYGKVHSSFWTSADMRELSEDGRTLAIYLLTCPHGTIAGCFRLPDGYVTDDLQWSSQRVSKGFAELLAKGFANRCETTKWVWILKHLEWNPPENPNQRKAAQKIARQIPSQCGWIAQYIRDCALPLEWTDAPDLEPLPNGCETLSKPVTVAIAVTEAVPVAEASPRKAATELPAWLPADRFAAFVAHRRAIKKPMTDEAQRLLVVKLEGMRAAGHDVTKLLNTAIERGWQTVYEPDGKGGRVAPPAAPLAGKNFREGVTDDGRIH